jgi:hypothetical protein
LSHLFCCQHFIFFVKFWQTHYKIAQLRKIKKFVSVGGGLIVYGKKHFAHGFAVKRLAEIFMVLYQGEFFEYILIHQDAVYFGLTL